MQRFQQRPELVRQPLASLAKRINLHRLFARDLIQVRRQRFSYGTLSLRGLFSARRRLFRVFLGIFSVHCLWPQLLAREIVSARGATSAPRSPAFSLRVRKSLLSSTPRTSPAKSFPGNPGAAHPIFPAESACLLPAQIAG